MAIRGAAPADLNQLARMRRRLLPDEDRAALDRELPAMLADESYAVFVAEEEGALSGFVEVGMRSYAEGGPDGPAAYIEGIWVEPERRRRGIAGALLAAAEAWARGRGLYWLGSDALIDNALSHSWHEAAGFAEVERLVVFGKRLADGQRAARRSPDRPSSASRRPGASASAAS